MKSIVFFFFVFCVLLLGSCRGTDKNLNEPFLGKWTLILWNNQEQKGTLVFTDSLLYFDMNHQMEVSKYKIVKDTFRAVRVGGNMSYLSVNDYWMVRQIDSVFFKLISSRGNVVTAYKEKKFWGIKDKPDTLSISL